MRWYVIIKIKVLCPRSGSHRKVKQTDNLCSMQDSGSLAVFKVTARDQGQYKGPSRAFVTHCNISCSFFLSGKNALGHKWTCKLHFPTISRMWVCAILSGYVQFFMTLSLFWWNWAYCMAGQCWPHGQFLLYMYNQSNFFHFFRKHLVNIGQFSFSMVSLVTIEVENLPERNETGPVTESDRASRA